MTLTHDERQLLRITALMAQRKSFDPRVIGKEASSPGGLSRLLEGAPSAPQWKDRTLTLLQKGLTDLAALDEFVDKELALADDIGATLVTVLDPAYPQLLLRTGSPPPFLFFQGQKVDPSSSGIAMVGSSSSTTAGLSRARDIAAESAANGITVISGMATGIDSAAHEGALDAGGSTWGVLPSGITKAELFADRELLTKTERNGTLVSQFWPSAASWSGPNFFTDRNAVIAGLSLATVVAEANQNSGALDTAYFARSIGRPVLLPHALIEERPWARRAVESGDAREFADFAELRSLVPGLTVARPVTHHPDRSLS